MDLDVFTEKYHRDDATNTCYLKWCGVEVARKRAGFSSSPVRDLRASVRADSPAVMHLREAIEAVCAGSLLLGYTASDGLLQCLEKLHAETHCPGYLASPCEPSTKGKTMNSIETTLLALQIMNGAKVYDIRFISEYGNKGRKSYWYKSTHLYKPGDTVVVPVFGGGETFAVGIVEGEAPDIELEELEYPLRWICFAIDDPKAINDRNVAADKAAKAKLASGRAKKAARDYLEAAGLDQSDFALLRAPTDEDTVDAEVIADDD